MSTSSSSFQVMCIEDGSTLHGSLMSTQNLSQAWTGDGAVPDWEETAANQPIIYVDLLSGGQRVNADSDGIWEYNGARITWNESGQSTDPVGVFQKVSDYTPVGYTSPVPAIKIVKNLANGAGVDTDSITFRGSYTMAQTPIAFAATILVTLTQIGASDIFGTIRFLGSNVITSTNPTVYLQGVLYGANREEITSGFTTSWYVNGTPFPEPGVPISIDGTNYAHAIGITAADITDNATVECRFAYAKSEGGTTTTMEYRAFASVDDDTDPEQLQIYSEGGTGSSRQLHRNDSVTFQFYMAMRSAPQTPIAWDYYRVLLINSDGTPNKSSLIDYNINNADADGYRAVLCNLETHVATLAIRYDMVKDRFGRYLTGYVYAANAPFTN